MFDRATGDSGGHGTVVGDAPRNALAMDPPAAGSQEGRPCTPLTITRIDQESIPLLRHDLVAGLPGRDRVIRDDQQGLLLDIRSDGVWREIVARAWRGGTGVTA